MQPRRRDARGNWQVQLGQELMEGLADRPRTDAASFGEGEQGSIGFTLPAMALFSVTSQTVSHSGPERHDSTLAELGLTDEECVLSEIHIAQLESGPLSGAQAQTIEQGEHGLVNQCPVRRSGPVGKRAH